MKQETLLSHNPSALSFHNNDQAHVDVLTPTIAWMPKDQRTQIGLYVLTQLIQLVACYYSLQTFQQSTTARVATIDFTTLKTLFMTLLILAYTKYYEPTLSTLDPEHNRLIIGLAILSLVANLATYFGFAILPLSQAATYQQMVPSLIAMLSYLLITPTDQKIFLFVAGQLVMSLLFDATLVHLVIILLAPICLSFMAVLRQIVLKPINQFTMLLYGNLLNLPLLVFLCLGFGSITGLTNHVLLLGALITSVFQLLSFIFMTEIIRSCIPTKEIWIISAACCALTLPLQLILFQEPLGVVPLVGQLVILISSILLE